MSDCVVVVSWELITLGARCCEREAAGTTTTKTTISAFRPKPPKPDNRHRLGNRCLKMLTSLDGMIALGVLLVPTTVFDTFCTVLGKKEPSRIIGAQMQMLQAFPGTNGNLQTTV